MSLNRIGFAKLFGVAAVAALCASAQPMTFSSGSTGTDGALNITAPGITYFSPTALNLSPAISNIFNFTTITIAAGSTLKLTEELFHGPAFFLATGNVSISGTLDLSGDNGNAVFPTGNDQSTRLQTYAGSGGYGGGLGGGSGGIPAPLPGNGPAGGAAGTAASLNGKDGGFTGSQYLIPLIGGSGGGGPYCIGGLGDPGGAGGGAILIASSGSITITGTINATGGSTGFDPCSPSGSGGGGAVRLIANTIAGTGSVNASSNEGNTLTSNTNPGRIRMEALQTTFTGSILCGCGLFSTPNALALPATGPSSLTVTSINGLPINANPFSFPDTTLNTTGPVIVNVQAHYIPVGTMPKIYVYGETGPDQTITCSALTGTLQSSACTASITFVTGGSRGFVKATW